MSRKIIINKQQKEAIEHAQGPLLIIAGAGTGKTTVITERIKHLTVKGLAKPSEILALTFTEKAAREMEERVDIALPYGYVQMWISTFHAFCDRVLRNEAVHIGLNPDFHLLTKAESIVFLRRHLFDFKLDYFRPHGNPMKFLQAMLTHFNRLKDEDITPEEYQKYFKKTIFANAEERKKTKELTNAFLLFEKLKQKEGAMDFADLISNTLKLFRLRKNILASYRKQFKYILVDEFQDTNITQNELAILLAGRKANLTCVCDDDQAIYRWRGAAVSNIIQFKKHFPKARIISLTKNYRSTQEILDRAYDLIKYNNPDRLEVKEGINKKLTSKRRIKGEKIKFFFTERVENEAEAVAIKIKKLVKSDNYDWKDIALLVRANNHAESFMRAFRIKGVPFQFLGPGQLFRQEEVKDLIAYLKLLSNYEDSVAMHRILSMDIFDLPARDLAAVRTFAKKSNSSLFETCEIITQKSPEPRNTSQRISISQKGIKKIKNIVNMIHRHMGLVSKNSAGQILFYFLEDTGLLQKVSDYQTAKDEQKAQNLAKFFDKLKSYETEHEDTSVEAVLDWITMKMELGESPLATDTDWTQQNRVNILTTHSSKGLEFPIVFIVNLVSQRFPSRERKEKIPIPDKLIKEILPEGDAHEQEERRLFYVGMTRAQDMLFLTAAKYYGEGKRKKRISPFVVEALKTDEETLISKGRISPANQLSIFDWEKIKTPKLKPLPTAINYLSYSQINSFKTCPLQYRYRNVLQIPVPQSHAQSFGASIHNALADFYNLHKEGKNPKKKELFEALKLRWQSEGYAGKAHERRAFNKAKRTLGTYFEKAFDSRTKPLAIEEIFKIRILPNLWLGGRIDRVDALSEGGLEIIDYKTGKVPERKKIEDSLQMTIYALAASDRGIYNQKPQQIKLSFYYLNNQKKISTKRTKADLKEAKGQIIELKNKIQSSSFKPTPGPWCDFCDFKILCPSWK